ncbi:MAG: flagellar basal body P-ring formation chaperone FlgA [Opitutales bacterium]
MSFCRQILLLVGLAGVLTLALDASQSRTVSLSSLLAPVGDLRAEKAEEKEVVEEEAPTDRVRYRMVKLSDLLSRMEDRLNEELGASESIRLKSRFNWSGFKLREDLDWDVRFKDPFEPRDNGRWYPALEILVDGQAVSEYRIPVQVSHLKKVWVVDQNVSRGDLVGGQAVKSERRDVYAERGEAIPASESLANFEAARSLTRGRVLSWADLEERPQVRKNAIVDVEFTKGALEIRMRGRAMDDGMLGDLITIRNLNTSREFIALVRGENLVEFEL